MKTKVLVRGPFLTRSGYGEHARYILRALSKYPDVCEIYASPITWGKTSWLYEDDAERRWLDTILRNTIFFQQQGGKFDIAVQVTIPNEWEKIAPINIGVTAGIETTKVSPQWIEKSFLVDKIIVPSTHAKQVYEKTSYQATNNETGETINDYRCQTPIEVIHYPVRDYDSENLGIKLDYNFNFLTVAQWGPRKNLENTILWFVEEFIDQEVGLVVKASMARNNIMDRQQCEKRLEQILNKYPNRKCKVYLLHGNMTNEEMSGLYKNKKIKALATLSHGEGFGLPIFEAAYNNLPVISPDWSGQCDFLHMPVKNKNKKIKNKAMFAKVDYTMGKISKEAVWEGVLQEDSMWCYPEQGSYKIRLREVYKDYNRFKSQANKLSKWIRKNFSQEKKYEQVASSILQRNLETNLEYVFINDFFKDQVNGGAELSLQALMDKCPSNYDKYNSVAVNPSMITAYKDKKWIFGNFTQLDPKLIEIFSSSNIDYSIIEFDYKFCKYRSIELHKALEEKECDCAESEHGKMIDDFFSKSKNIFFMSKKQMDIYLKHTNIDKDKCIVLSSVFDDDFFSKIEDLRNQYKDKKDEKWVVSSSPSWIKGAMDAERWCTNNNIDYEKLHDKTYDEALKMLAKSKGYCFLPLGGDTCPRMVIEAKLLNCDLELNNNVQHSEEEWFNTSDLQTIESYLKERPSVFWSSIQESVNV